MKRTKEITNPSINTDVCSFWVWYAREAASEVTLSYLRTEKDLHQQLQHLC